MKCYLASALFKCRKDSTSCTLSHRAQIACYHSPEEALGTLLTDYLKDYPGGRMESHEVKEVSADMLRTLLATLEGPTP